MKINLKENVKFRFPKANSNPVLVDTDPYRLQVVLLNLLNNAAKFTDEGTVTLDYDVQPDKVVFTVTDTGCGIAPGMEEEIFMRYNKGGNTNSEGDGLGLPVCRLIANLLGGSIELDTTYTGGARFIFTIPTSAAAN
ncbi:MAG: ATP-binding protein [Muribaculaceae bacterium]|nr:ATP-binding protein [Muribaculaceae bacterium]